MNHFLNQGKLLKGLILALSVFLASCRKDTSIPGGVNVYPGDLVYNTVSGNVESFRITGYSPEKINRIKITGKKANAFTSTLLDSTFTGRENFSMIWEYMYENAASDYEITIGFYLYDEAGKEYYYGVLAKVKVTDPLLTEYSGVTLYSSYSGKPNVLSLQEMITRSSWLSTNALQDIKIDSLPPLTEDSLLQRSWVSPAGGLFVKFNNFNFPQATENGLKSALNAGNLTDQVQNLQQGDIILYRKMDTNSVPQIEAAIRILNIIDEPGVENDRYDLSIKKLQ